ncbi:MAG: hypothetical protein L0241_12725 [Planctomycetia bacterium]|nr:hypothetical protein [Planctomycetia bacterium]
MWSGMVFNLCVALVLAAYLLRAVRRFERRADEIMAKLDQQAASFTAELDQQHEENMGKYDIARDEIRDSMRTQVDAAIAEMQTKAARATDDLNASVNGNPNKTGELNRNPTEETHPAS